MYIAADKHQKVVQRLLQPPANLLSSSVVSDKIANYMNIV
jgi:hypothetical protein